MAFKVLCKESHELRGRRSDWATVALDVRILSRIALIRLKSSPEP